MRDWGLLEIMVQVMIGIKTGTIGDNDTTSSRYISRTNGRDYGTMVQLVVGILVELMVGTIGQ